MTTDKKKTLNEIAAPSEQLQVAFDALMNFPLTTLVQVTEPTDFLQRLQQIAEREATISSLKAEDHGVTSGMVGVLRQAATISLSPWSSLRGKFDSAVQPFMEKINAVRDFETKKADIEQKMDQREAAIIAQAEAHKPYVERKIAKLEADRHYESLIQGEGGRPVNSFGRTWQYLLVLVGITSIEWLINFDSFFAWTGVPAIAAGFTIGMAVAVALAAHVHGEYLKQRNSRFGPASDTKGRDITYVLIATTGLIFAVVVAGWARYSLAMHNIGAQGPTIKIEGVGLDQPGPMTDVYFSLGINMIVWLIGLVIAFMSHDENHKLMEAWFARWRRTRQFNRIHKPWEKRIQTVKAQGARELDQLRAATDLAKVAAKEQRDMLDQVLRRDDAIYQVLANHLQGTVNLYRIALGTALKDNGNQIVIDGQVCTGQQYQNVAINLDAALLRSIIFRGPCA